MRNAANYFKDLLTPSPRSLGGCVSRRACTLGTPQEQHERQQRDEENPQKLKQTHERDDRGLTLHEAGNCRVGAAGRRGGVRSGREKRAPHLCERQLESRSLTLIYT